MLPTEAKLCAREARAAPSLDVLFWHGSYIDSEALNKARLWWLECWSYLLSQIPLDPPLPRNHSEGPSICLGGGAETVLGDFSELGLLGRRRHIVGTGLLCSWLPGTGWQPCLSLFADASEHSVRNQGLSCWWGVCCSRRPAPLALVSCSSPLHTPLGGDHAADCKASANFY